MDTSNRAASKRGIIKKSSQRTPVFESLEPRLLLSADLIGAAPPAPPEANIDQPAVIVDSRATVAPAEDVTGIPSQPPDDLSGTFDVAIAAAAGMPQLGPEQRVTAGGTDLQVLAYSVPAPTDWNADGLLDLVVGEKFDTVSGKVRVYLNSGSPGAPVYSSFFYVRANGSDLTVPAGGCLGAYPRVYDWNQDGRKDLLIGLADGTIRLYLNTGTAANPSFGSGSTLQAGAVGAKVNLDVGDRATFDIADWNNDGAVDLVAGALDGRVRVYLNRQAGGQPDLASPIIVQEAGSDLLVPSGRSSVVVHDFNRDGRQDLLLGNTDAQVLFYPNQGTNAAPVFDGYEMLAAIAGGSRSRPCVADFNADGISDLLVGNVDGLVRYYLGAVAGAERTVGHATVFPYVSQVANRRAMPFVMSEDGALQSISIYHQGGTGHAILAVYADAGGQPGSRLGVTASTPINGTEGWQTVSLQTPVNASAGETIWLAWVFENDPGMRWAPGAPGRALSTATWAGGMPTTFGGSSSYDGIYSIYASYIPARADQTLGNTTVFPSISQVPNRRAVPYVMTEDGSIESISIYHQGGTGHAVLAVYGDAGGQPGNRLGVTNSTSINSAEGWQTIALQAPVNASAGQTVWLAWVFENDPGMRWAPGGSGRAMSPAAWSGGMPASFGVSNPYDASYSIYATYRPRGVDETIGNTTVFPQVSLVANRRAMPFVMSQNGSIESISIYHQGGTGHAIVAVYGDAGGQPGTRLGVTAPTPINSTEGWQTISLQAPVNAAAGETIWLAWVFENDPGMRWAPGAPGRALSTATWAGGMPTTFGASSSYDGIYSIYATYRPDSVVPADVVVDNHAAAASSTGFWYVSGGPNPWGADSMVSWTPGSTFTFAANLVPGRAYAVYAWWTQSFCRYPAVPYEIRDGSTLLNTVAFNQTINGGTWNPLGVYTFTDVASVRILAAPTADWSTNADAVRFVPVP